MKTIKQIQDEKIFDYDQLYEIESGFNKPRIQEMFDLENQTDADLKALKSSIKKELEDHQKAYEFIVYKLKTAKKDYLKTIEKKINQNRSDRWMADYKKRSAFYD